MKPSHCYHAGDYSAGRHHEMISFGEKRAMRYVKDDPVCLLRHNYRQMTRVYPTGSRFDSSNYDPVPLWNAGCQLGKDWTFSIPFSQPVSKTVAVVNAFILCKWPILGLIFLLT